LLTLVTPASKLARSSVNMLEGLPGAESVNLEAP